MARKQDNREFTRFIYRAWARDRHGAVHTGEALMLACLMQTKGVKSKDYQDVQRIMKDVNVNN